jgi:DNA-binding NarL/FixJ family response regulator
VAEGAVKIHLHAIYEKLDIHTRAERLVATLEIKVAG